MRLKALSISLFTSAILFVFFLIKPAYADTFAVAGAVTDNTGTAVIGATVDVFTQGTTTDVVTPTTTDQSGEYSFSSVPQGTYDIKVTPPAGDNFSPIIALNQNISSS